MTVRSGTGGGNLNSNSHRGGKTIVGRATAPMTTSVWDSDRKAGAHASVEVEVHTSVASPSMLVNTTITTPANPDGIRQTRDSSNSPVDGNVRKTGLVASMFPARRITAASRAVRTGINRCAGTK